MAEAVFNKLCKDRNQDMISESAGLCTITGLAMSVNSQEALKSIGIEAQDFKSTSVEDVDMDVYSVFATMTPEHAQVLKGYGISHDKICVLSEATGGISDPYGCSVGRYVQCLEEISCEVTKLFEKLSEKTEVMELDISSAKAVAEIDKSTFESPWSLSTIESLTGSDKAVVFGALCDSQLAGYGVLEWVCDEGSLTNIAVDPRFRRRGIAGRIMEEIISKAKSLELAFVTLEVRASNTPAISLYRKFGFEEVGKRPGYYSSPVEDALLMTLYLND